MRVLRHIVAWAAALLLLLWRATCRYRVINDPRPALRAAGRPYVYALLHAHQVAAVLVNDEPRMAAMVSRSADGDLLVPSLRVRRVVPVRGSTRSMRGGVQQDKGGRHALEELMELVREIPVLIAVDGPRGPRGHIHRGVEDLAVRTGAVVLPVIVTADRRWVLSRTWDRFQIPKPFSIVQLIFGKPVFLEILENNSPVEPLRDRVARELAALEERYGSPP